MTALVDRARALVAAPLTEPCPHHTPDAGGAIASELHGVCIFCWRDRAAQARSLVTELAAEAERLRAALTEVAEWSQALQDRMVAQEGGFLAQWRGCVAATRAALGEPAPESER